jgi:hypothetical protein
LGIPELYATTDSLLLLLLLLGGGAGGSLHLFDNVLPPQRPSPSSSYSAAALNNSR